MIRQIGKKEDPTEYLALMQERLTSMETLASTHITWYTHKNPYGCWICDMFQHAQSLINSFSEFLGPTPADAVEDGQTLIDSSETMEEPTDDSES